MCFSEVQRKDLPPRLGSSAGGGLGRPRDQQSPTRTPVPATILPPRVTAQADLNSSRERKLNDWGMGDGVQKQKKKKKEIR